MVRRARRKKKKTFLSTETIRDRNKTFRPQTARLQINVQTLFSVATHNKSIQTSWGAVYLHVTAISDRTGCSLWNEYVLTNVVQISTASSSSTVTSRFLPSDCLYRHIAVMVMDGPRRRDPWDPLEEHELRRFKRFCCTKLCSS